MDSLVTHLPEIVIKLLTFAFALSIHEAAHGWMAERLGDPTARWLGRITLNPIKHIDPFGSVIFPLMLAAIGAPVMGWAKPVPFVSRNLRQPRRDAALIGLAGPVSNIGVAVVATIVLVAAKVTMPGFRELLVVILQQGALGVTGIAPPLVYLAFQFAVVNLVLAVFNLIPIPPLDGSHVLSAILPADMAYRFEGFYRYGMLILFALMWTGVFGYLLNPFLRVLLWILLS
jgi:Zn-dependent protease